jgi:hypothetical protein
VPQLAAPLHLPGVGRPFVYTFHISIGQLTVGTNQGRRCGKI